jgi:hypothetical protein
MFDNPMRQGQRVRQDTWRFGCRWFDTTEHQAIGSSGGIKPPASGRKRPTGRVTQSSKVVEQLYWLFKV